MDSLWGVEDGHLQRALSTLSFAVELTRPEPKLRFGQIIANAQDNTLDMKRRATQVAPNRRLSMNELQAERYLTFDFEDDEEDEEEDEHELPSPGSGTPAKFFRANSQSFKDLQRRTPHCTMAEVTSCSHPVVSAMKDKKKLMHDIKTPQSPGPGTPIARAPSMLRVPSMSRSPSQQLSPGSPSTLLSPTRVQGPCNSSSELLLEQLQALKPSSSRRFSLMDLARPRMSSGADADSTLRFTRSSSSVLDSVAGFAADAGDAGSRPPTGAGQPPEQHGGMSEPLPPKMAPGPAGIRRPAPRRNSLASFGPKRPAPPDGSGGTNADGLGCMQVASSLPSLLGLRGSLASGGGSGVLTRLRRQSGLVATTPRQRTALSLGGNEGMLQSSSPSVLATPEPLSAGTGAGALPGVVEKLPLLHGARA